MARNIKGVGVPGDIPRNAIAGSARSVHPAMDGKLPGVKNLPAFTPKKLQRIDVDLSTARDNQLFNLSGTGVWIPNGSDAAAVVDIAFDDQDNGPIPMLPGAMISGLPFGRLYLTNAAQAGESLVIVVFSDRPDNRIDIE